MGARRRRSLRSMGRGDRRANPGRPNAVRPRVVRCGRWGGGGGTADVHGASQRRVVPGSLRAAVPLRIPTRALALGPTLSVNFLRRLRLRGPGNAPEVQPMLHGWVPFDGGAGRAHPRDVRRMSPQNLHHDGETHRITQRCHVTQMGDALRSVPRRPRGGRTEGSVDGVVVRAGGRNRLRRWRAAGAPSSHRGPGRAVCVGSEQPQPPRRAIVAHQPCQAIGHSCRRVVRSRPIGVDDPPRMVAVRVPQQQFDPAVGGLVCARLNDLGNLVSIDRGIPRPIANGGVHRTTSWASKLRRGWCIMCVHKATPSASVGSWSSARTTAAEHRGIDRRTRCTAQARPSMSSARAWPTTFDSWNPWRKGMERGEATSSWPRIRTSPKRTGGRAVPVRPVPWRCHGRSNDQKAGRFNGDPPAFSGAVACRRGNAAEDGDKHVGVVDLLGGGRVVPIVHLDVKRPKVRVPFAVHRQRDAERNMWGRNSHCKGWLATPPVPARRTGGEEVRESRGGSAPVRRRTGSAAGRAFPRTRGPISAACRMKRATSRAFRGRPSVGRNRRPAVPNDGNSINGSCCLPNQRPTRKGGPRRVTSPEYGSAVDRCASKTDHASTPQR